MKKILENFDEKFWSVKDTELVKNMKSILTQSIKQAFEETYILERKLLHQVVGKGSQEDLNDTWRKGYNQAIQDKENKQQEFLKL